MKLFIPFAIICFTGITTFAQEGTITWNESNPLSWNYFSGKVKDTSIYDAEVFAEVKYNYKFYSLKEYEFEVKAHFNPHTSWSRLHRQCNDLLKHEQIHFDIAEVYARKIKAAFESYTYTLNFAAEILQIFNEKKAEYHAMQQQYDEETNHSQNKDKQKEWEGFVYEQLGKTSSTVKTAVSTSTVSTR